MKQKIKIAAPQSHPIDLSRHHFTTMNFGMPIPLFSEEVYPGDNISVRPDCFCRTSPLFLPTYSDVNLNLRSFFVPYSQVWPYFNDFIAGLPCHYPDGDYIVKKCPTISSYEFVRMFIGEETNGFFHDTHFAQYKGYIKDSAATSLYDFFVAFGRDDANAPCFKLTPRGKQVLQVLHALGYNFNWVYSEQYGKNSTYSALPLLCFFKLYLDWYVPSQLQPSNGIHILLNRLKTRTPNDGGFIALTKDDFRFLFLQLFSYYDNNYFTSAWLSPNAPAPHLNYIGNSTSDNVTSPGASATVVNTSNNNVIVTQGLLSDYGLNLLQKFSSFIRRNNWSGSRAIERILARFGVKPEELVIDMSEYLGGATVRMSVMDVVSQGSVSAGLGDYAGKGFINQPIDKAFSYKSKDIHGFFFIVGSLNVPSNFLDGDRRRLYHISPLDYYTPEFDGTLMQATFGSELTGKLSLTKDDEHEVDVKGLNDTHTFGYVPRYAEMKTALDDISGDFDVPSIARTIDPFIMPRRLINKLDYVLNKRLASDQDGASVQKYFYDGEIEIKQSSITPLDVIRGDDSVQFNRIFRSTTGEADPFFFKFRFDALFQRRCLPPNDIAELLGRGSEIETQTNGVYVN